MNGLPTADDFEPLKDQIRAYEEIGGGGEGGRGGAKGGGGGRSGGWMSNRRKCRKSSKVRVLSRFV